MTDLSALGLVSFGIVLTLAVLGGFVLYVFRGHRADWTGLRIVRSDSWKEEKLPYLFRTGDYQPATPPAGRWNPAIEYDDEANGDSERPPAVQQHGARTREVGDT